MRTRLRDMPTQEQLDKLYAKPHQHDRWLDHVMRAEVTIGIGISLPLPHKCRVADLSCGDAYIPQSIALFFDGVSLLGDYAPGYHYTGPIEETIGELRNGLDGRNVDLFTCCETLEHLDDPETVLREIGTCADRLLISTPIAEDKTYRPENIEHVWGWDTVEIDRMLLATGWVPMLYNQLMLQRAGFMYDYQIWYAEREHGDE